MCASLHSGLMVLALLFVSAGAVNERAPSSLSRRQPQGLLPFEQSQQPVIVSHGAPQPLALSAPGRQTKRGTGPLPTAYVFSARVRLTAPLAQHAELLTVFDTPIPGVTILLHGPRAPPV